MTNDQRQQVESKTGDLYSDCWEYLTDEQWLAQGELLADQLGLDEAQVAGKTVFDGGCGHGAFDYRLAKLGAKEVVGFDLKPNPKMSLFADAPQVRFVQGSLLEIPFPDASFDLVVTSGVVHHTADPDKVFAELARLVKPGGRLIMGVYGKYGLFPWSCWLARLFTVRLPIIREPFMRKVCDMLKLDPIWRYQVLDYLYVPILHRFTPNGIRERFFNKHGFQNVERIRNLPPERASSYVKRNASYTYDYTSLSSRILFGHGFITIRGDKPSA